MRLDHRRTSSRRPKLLAPIIASIAAWINGDASSARFEGCFVLRFALKLCSVFVDRNFCAYYKARESQQASDTDKERVAGRTFSPGVRRAHRGDPSGHDRID